MKAEFIPNGVDLSRFGNFPRRSETKAGALRILSVGRLVKTKGQSYLIKALALLRRDHPGSHLTLVGQGPLKAKLTKLAESLGVRDSIDFVETVPFEKMPEFIVDFDVLVMPSIFEGFNIMVLEALASGVPVALSDIPGFRDIVDESQARFFPPENPEEIAKILASFVRNPEELKILSAQGKACAQAYHWARSADAEALVYSTAR